MSHWMFVSDLHGRRDRYEKLWERIAREAPAAVLLGGDLVGARRRRLGLETTPGEHPWDVIAAAFGRLRQELHPRAPEVLLIFGNDDPRADVERVRAHAAAGAFTYLEASGAAVGDFVVYGYPYVPPSPFPLKDWERYDVSPYVDPGCTPPDEGYRTVPVSAREMCDETIADDLAGLIGNAPPSRTVLLCHSAPYRTNLDRADLDGRRHEGVPLDVHIGSVALRRLIDAQGPHITLHGHVHESARLTGSWQDRIGPTHLFSAAHDGPELALVRFDPTAPAEATRELV